MTDQELIAHLEARNKALQAELRKPRRDPVAERLYAENKSLRAQLRTLERELDPLREAQQLRDQLAADIRDVKPAPWLFALKAPKHGPGVPLFDLSDLHLNEIVRPEEVAYRNEFSPAIAMERLQRVTENAIDIAFNHMVIPRGWRYPGAVVVLGGDILDFLAGRVHESDAQFLPLRQSLEHSTTAVARSLRALHDAFRRLLIVCIPGNHGRTTPRMPMSGVADSNLDAVVYDNLRTHSLLAEREITWEIAAGDEARFLVWDHAFVATHGYQYRGGDGEVGALGPIQRGVKRLRAKYMQLGLRVDTVLVHHFHHLVFDPGNFIINGSLKGYDSMAMRYSFPYQPAMQALLFVHPERGITATWGVHAEEKAKRAGTVWASVERAA